MAQQPMMVSSGLVKGPLPMMMVQQPRMVVQQPRMVVQQPGVQVRNNMQVSPLVVKNPATMRMSTEYTEPYIKRDGYVQENCGVIGQTTTKVIRRGQSVNRPT